MSTTPLRNVTGRRLLAALAAVLALFGAALTVELFTLQRIADAEADVDRLDQAKHAGHMVAAQVREQYIHQAHTLIEFGEGHLGHYAKVVVVTREAIAHLQAIVDTDEDKALAARMAQLAEQNDRDFREQVVPAVERGDRSGVAELGDKLEATVDEVVDLNAKLNDGLEQRSAGARERAEHLRSQAVVATIACFALAIALAAGLGLWLTRAIVRRVDRLRRGASQIGSGDLAARIGLDGNVELNELAATFNQMASSLAREQAALVRSQKLASIGQVAAGVAHELNNPLSVILGYTKILRGESGANADELRIIDDEARQCQRIVAEISASIIDLPVLDSLAGSLDLDTLRLRASDGAVQLWESLLARNPSTPLRPLTLYRLGWAYRESIASGFPGSSDLAFDEIASKYGDSPYAPLAAEAKGVAWKSQGSATAWSIVPGLGQMYAGEYGNGALRLTIAVAAVAMIVVPSALAYERRNDLSWHHDWPLILTGIAGVTILTSDYSSSYQDAQRAVLEFNERHEAAFEDGHPTAP